MSEESQIICRTCLNQVEDSGQSISIHSYAKTLQFENLLIKDMMEKCVPEMDLEMCDNTIICTTCYGLLISTYTFKSKCFDTEERIYLYIEKNNLKLGDKLDLNCVLEKNNTNNFQYDDTQQAVEKHVLKEKELKTINISSSGSEDVKVMDDDTDSESDKISCRDKAAETPSPYLRREYTCDKCEYKAYRWDLLKRHLVYKCKNNVKDNVYKCDSCPYTTVRKRHLTRHKFTHGGNRPYVCGICDKGFTEKNHIKDHMYKHSGYKLPFKCGEGGCKAAYARKCDLNAHIRTHVKYKPFMCKLCIKAFLNQAQWNQHMGEQHGMHFPD